MKNYNTIYFLVLIICLLSCRRTDPLTEETCSSGEKGRFSFNVSNGESYEMLVNNESSFIINQVTHPTEGTGLFISNSWKTNSNTTYGISGQFNGGAILGSTTYDSTEDEGGFAMTIIDTDANTSIIYNSTNITLNINEANLCLVNMFCPIEATFSGEFTKNSNSTLPTENVTVNGSFCLYQNL